MHSGKTARRLLSIGIVGALAAAGLTVTEVAATPAPARAAYPDAVNPFAMNGGFTVYARQDLTINNDETEGSLAAGGVTTLRGDGEYAVLHVVAGTGDYGLPTVDGDPTRLLTGSYNPDSDGILAITNAGTTETDLLGDLKMVQRDGPFQAFTRSTWLRLNTNPSNPDQTPIIDATAQRYPADAAPPSSAVGDGSIYTVDTSATAVADYVEASRDASYEQAAQCLADVADPGLGIGYHVGIAEDVGDRVVLAPLSADQPNIVDYADISGATLMQLSPGPTPGATNPLIIRVPAGTTTVRAPRMDPQGAYSPYMFWDLSQVTGDVTVNAANARIDGSVYAPEANVTVNGSPVDGQVIGENVVLRGGEVHSFMFRGSIPCNADSGTFRVRKDLQGIDADDLPAGTSFTVNYTATEPDGTVIEDSLELTASGQWTEAGSQFPIGTVIDFDEVTPASVPGYEWGTPTITPDPLTIGAGTADVVVTNEATAQAGTFSVAKSVVSLGPGQPTLDPGVTLPVTWTAVFGGAQIGTGTLEVPLDGTAVSVGEDFPLGTHITLAEDLTGVTPPSGYHWVDVSWNPGDAFDITDDGATVAVTMTNTVAPDGPGRTISIAKSAEGAASDPAFGYSVSYNTDPAGTRTSRALEVGVPIALDDVETGADVIELAEEVPTHNGAPVDPSQWELPVISVTADGQTTVYRPAAFDDGTNTAAAIVDIPLPESGDISIDVANAQRQGTFELRKAFAGISGENLPEGLTFTVAWTATDPAGTVTRGVLRLPGNGTPVGPLDSAGDAVQFPFGTEITYTELAPPLTRWLEWGARQSGSLTIGSDGQATVTGTVTNSADVREGTFQVRKSLVGIDPDQLQDDSFTIDYTARLPLGHQVSGSFRIPADGTAAGPTENGTPVLFPIGTIARLDEATPSAGDLPPGYAWSETTWSPSTFLLVRANTTAQVEVTNTAVELGRFSVEKQLTGDAGSLVPDDTTFPVDWWVAGDAQTPLDAGVGSPTVSPYLPVGTIVDLAEGERPAVAGVTWGPVTWTQGDVTLTPNDDGRVTTQVTHRGDPLALVMTNAASNQATAAFSVTKTITGSAASTVDPDTAYTLEYTVDGGAARALTVRAGESTQVDDLPATGTVRIRERAPSPGDGYVWGEAAWTIGGRSAQPGADGWVTVPLHAGDTVSIGLENTATASSLPVTGGGGVAWWLPMGALLLILAGLVLVLRRVRVRF
jgi:choice-of-anchor A domain-containing protein